MSEEKQLWFIRGDIITGKEMTAIEENTIWSMWDPMFCYFQCVFDDEGFALAFALKYSDSIVEHKKITEKEWQNYTEAAAERDSKPAIKTLTEQFLDPMLSNKTLIEMMTRYKRFFIAEREADEQKHNRDK